MANNPYLKDPGLHYPGAPGLSFSNYIQQCQALIQHNRLDLTQTTAETIISANSPYDLLPTTAPAKVGALLVHGLLDSPFVMKDIALGLQAQGLHTRSLLLPGHGTVPGALLNIQYQDWLQTLEYGIESLSQEVDQIFLVGYSTGATLALHHLLQNPSAQIAGLIMLAPAIKICSPFESIQQWPLLLGQYWERAKWLYISEENDYAKYQSIPFNAGHQVYLLAQAVLAMSAEKKLRHPILSIIAEDDKTVSTKATLQYLEHYAPKHSQQLIYTRHDLTSHDARVVKRPAIYKDDGIINFSHIALPNAPRNPHYGNQGDYSLASHIEENLKNGSRYVYGASNNVKNKFNSLFYYLGLNPHLQLRLTFNPDFEFMQQTIHEFISTTLD